MSSKVKLGYIIAYKILENAIVKSGPKNMKERKLLFDALDDMKYCIEQTKRCEQYDEIENIKENLKKDRPKQ